MLTWTKLLTWTATARMEWHLPWLNTAVKIPGGLEKSASGDAINVVRSLLDLKSIAINVMMISSIYFSNMIVRVIMVLPKMCSNT